VAETAGANEFPEPSDGVEIKFSFSDGGVRDVLESFHLREESAQRMRIFFFDALRENAGELRMRLLEAE
jgi:hypothetical protein